LNRKSHLFRILTKATERIIMEIILLGFDHSTTHVNLREKVAFPPQLIKNALTRLVQKQHTIGTIREAVILSTCNRVEIYCAAENQNIAIATVKDFIAKFHGLSREEFEQRLQILSNKDAVEHLFLVAGSLKSMVLGENQIQGQIKEAFETAQSCRSVGPILTHIFQSALTVGKRVRSETIINQNSLSISHAAVNFLGESFEDLSTKNVLVVGSGKMGRMAVKALLKSGCPNITIVNRTKESAKQFAEELGVQAFGFDHFEDCLSQTDAVISSTGAPEPILHKDNLRRVMQTRHDRPLHIIDIAVPRDVAPDVTEIKNVILHNIDHLKSEIEANLSKRANEINKVKDIVHDELEKYANWIQTLKVTPIISDLKNQAEQIRELELQRALHRLGDSISENDGLILEELTKRIINKMLHNPIIQLREQANEAKEQNFTSTVRTLFGLNELSTVDYDN